MGEYERSALGREKSLASAVWDIFTPTNFLIAIVAALIGYILVEFLRKRL
jgi:hypothetical protein